MSNLFLIVLLLLNSIDAGGESFFLKFLALNLLTNEILLFGGV